MSGYLRDHNRRCSLASSHEDFSLIVSIEYPLQSTELADPIFNLSKHVLLGCLSPCLQQDLAKVEID